MKKAFSKRYLDLWAGVFTLLAAVLLYLTTLGIRSFSLSQIRPAMIPRVVCVLMFALGIGILIKWGVQIRKTPAAQPQEDQPAAPAAGLVQKITAPVTFILIFAYIYGMKIIGFTTATALYLTCQITLMSTVFSLKSWLSSLLIGTAVAILVFLAFSKGFSLALPVNGLGF